jgi:hypothetical protein
MSVISTEVVKYSGRSQLVTVGDDILNKAKVEIQELSLLVECKKNDIKWKALIEDLLNLEILLHSTSSSSSSSIPMRNYQLRILLDSVFPYIRELNSRMVSIEPSRYDQLKHLMELLIQSEDYEKLKK